MNVLPHGVGDKDGMSLLHHGFQAHARKERACGRQYVNKGYPEQQELKREITKGYAFIEYQQQLFSILDAKQ